MGQLRALRVRTTAAGELAARPRGRGPFLSRAGFGGGGRDRRTGERCESRNPSGSGASGRTEEGRYDRFRRSGTPGAATGTSAAAPDVPSTARTAQLSG